MQYDGSFCPAIVRQFWPRSTTCLTALAIYLVTVVTVNSATPIEVASTSRTTDQYTNRSNETVLPSSARVRQGDKKLLLVLLDGFRWDYVDKYDDLIGFKRLRNEGVYAEYSTPIFPAMTLPNLYSIVTGRYPESHGILENYMYDRQLNEYFETGPMKNNINNDDWWQDADPLWIQATRAGLRAHIYLWPGCNVTFGGIRPVHCTDYFEAYGAFNFRQNVYEVVEKFQYNETDLAMIYVESTDFVGHVFGPETQMSSLAIHDVDSVINRLIYRLKQKQLQDKVNVIVMSDHGMTRTDAEFVKKFRLSDHINLDDVEILLDGGPVVGIIAVDKTRIAKLYNILKKVKELQVWLSSEIPEKFHYKKHKRVPDILIVAKRGYVTTAIPMTRKQLPYVPYPLIFDIMQGNHGYLTDDFPDMRGILYGWGPDMKQDQMVPPTRTIDVYNLAMHLLGLEPSPNNGSWEAVRAMLKNDEVPLTN